MGDACCEDCANTGGSCQDDSKKTKGVPAPTQARVSFIRGVGLRGGADPLTVLRPAGLGLPADIEGRTYTTALDSADRKDKGMTVATTQGNTQQITSTLGAAPATSPPPATGFNANPTPPPANTNILQRVPWWGWAIGGVAVVGGAGALAYTLAKGSDDGASASEDSEAKRAEIRARMAKLSGGSSAVASEGNLDKRRAEIRARMARAVNGRR